MTILDSFKKLASRWGKEVTGDNIADVVSDFADNLPFGVKTEMVEIVPEQSVVFERDSYVMQAMPTNQTPVLLNTLCTVVFEGTTYNGYFWDGGEDLSLFSDESNQQIPFSLHSGTEDDMREWKIELVWLREYNKIGVIAGGVTSSVLTATIEVLQEQEVVTPIDPKFTPTYFVVNWDGENVDKTLEDVVKAVKAGKNVYLNRWGNAEEYDLIPLTHAANWRIVFTDMIINTMNDGTEQLYVYHYQLTEDGLIETIKTYNMTTA